MYLYHYCNLGAKLQIIFFNKEIYSVKLVIKLPFNYILTLFCVKMPLSDLKYRNFIRLHDNVQNCF